MLHFHEPSRRVELAPVFKIANPALRSPKSLPTYQQKFGFSFQMDPVIEQLMILPIVKTTLKVEIYIFT